jgi:hypothetical protein
MKRLVLLFILAILNNFSPGQTARTAIVTDSTDAFQPGVVVEDICFEWAPRTRVLFVALNEPAS